MATMGACRLLLVCVFCALLCSPAVTAAELSSVGEKDELSQKVREAMMVVGEPLGAQAVVVYLSKTLLESLKEVADRTEKIKAATLNDTEAKNVLEEAKTLDTEKRAQNLKNAAQKVTTAATNAGTKTKKLADDAVKWASKSKENGDVKEKTLALEKAAESATESWETAAEAATSQSASIEKALKEVGDVKTKTEGAEKTLPNTGSDKANVEKAFKELTEALKKITTEEREVKTAVQKVSDAINAAFMASREMDMAVVDLIAAAREETHKKENTKTTENDPKATQNTPGGTDVKTTNANSGNTVTGATTPDKSKDSSPDGSPLTVSRLAATSVLLLLARVAAVMISA